MKAVADEALLNGMESRSEFPLHHIPEEIAGGEKGQCRTRRGPDIHIQGPRQGAEEKSPGQGEDRRTGQGKSGLKTINGNKKDYGNKVVFLGILPQGVFVLLECAQAEILS